MKKLLLLLSLSIVFNVIILRAQEYNTTIGLKVYPSLSSAYNQEDFVSTISYRFTVSKGLEFKQRLYKNSIFLESGLYLFKRGFTSDDILVDDYANALVHEHLTLPISLITKFNNFYCGIGPNLNYYLRSKNFQNGALTGKGKFPFFSDFIIGAQVYTGYEFKIAKNIFGSVEAFVSPTFKEKYLNYGLGIAVKYAFLQGEVEK